MNSPRFTSPLMQQLASAARGQSRPPLALAQLYGDSHQQQPQRRALPSSSSSSLGGGSPPPPRSLSTRPRPLHAPENAIASNHHSRQSLSAVPYASETSDPPSCSTANADSNQRLDATTLQSLLRSRRTISNLIPPNPSTHPPNFLHDALSRAVQCAVEAPNHKRTEPYTFTRFASPSSATDALADVCYHISVRRMRERQKGSESSLQAEAERKRDRWKGIPAFLVATVRDMPDQLAGWDGADEYAELPFVPPATERQLEDYASACAAVQNVLLSLHSEGIGSKWATGPVIRTRAFRDTIQIRDDDFVVGLVMVGMPKRAPRSPRRRRELAGDVLRDI